MSFKIAVMAGDGIGPEIVSATVRTLSRLDAGLEFIPADVGMGAFERKGEYLPAETLSIIEESDAILAGCVIDPVSTKGYRNPFDEIKKRLDLFADVRRVGDLPPKASDKRMPITVVTENPHVESSISEVERSDGIVLERHINYDLCKRITTFAAEIVTKTGRNSVTCIHRASNAKMTNTLLRDAFTKTMTGTGITHCEMNLMDAIPESITNPDKFDVVVTLSPYGDPFLAGASTFAGGSNLIPSASLGHGKKGFFEPLHGAMPDLAGKDLANPVASLLSATMMLRHLGLVKHADTLMDALKEAKKQGYQTADMGGSKGTKAVTTKICEIIDAFSLS